MASNKKADMARNEVTSDLEQRAQRDETQACDIVDISPRKYVQRDRVALQPSLKPVNLNAAREQSDPIRRCPEKLSNINHFLSCRLTWTFS